MITRKLTLKIHQQPGYLQASLRRHSSDIPGQLYQFDIPLRPKDLSDTYKELSGYLANVARKVGGKLSLSKEDHDSIQNDFQTIAEIGHEALNVFFYKEGLRFLKQSVSGASRVIFEVDSNAFVFPWEFIYDDYSYDSLKYENFWGFKYIIYRSVEAYTGHYLPPAEIYISPAHVGLLADRALTNVAQIEIPFLEEMAERQDIKLLSFSCDYDLTRRHELIATSLKSFLAQDNHILHFAGHTRGSFPELKEPHGQYCLLLSKEKNFPLWPRDFRVSPLVLESHPLVILNACGTTPRDPQRTRGLVQTLLRHGAGGVVATESLIPDAFAATFTRKFYPLLLEGQELGDALFNTRQTFLSTPYSNPLGLLYALYASPHTRFIRSN